MYSFVSLRSHIWCPLAVVSAVVVSALICLFLPLQVSAQTTASGYFNQHWGDAFDEELPPRERYFLTDTAGNMRELLLSSSLAAKSDLLRGFIGKAVSVTTEQSMSRLSGGSTPTLFVTSISLNEEPSAALREAGVSGNQPWVSIMCKFADTATEPRNLAYFSSMYSSLYPGLDHYWREASYNSVNINGSSAHGWYTLPRERSYYVSGGSLNFVEITNDCIALADSDVFFPTYAGINLMFNDDLDGYAWGGSTYLVVDGREKNYRMTW
ncbi:MAG TPA: hypothetical protein VJ969_07655, partial [Desulfopila sp.]|nr:hypothetical protein [Desulfopila sp.]